MWQLESTHTQSAIGISVDLLKKQKNKNPFHSCGILCSMKFKKMERKKNNQISLLIRVSSSGLSGVYFCDQRGAHRGCCESGSTRIFTSRRFTGALVPFRLLVHSSYLQTSTYSFSIRLNLNTCGPILRTGKTRITRYVSWCPLRSSMSHTQKCLHLDSEVAIETRARVCVCVRSCACECL